jgi:hypothetical protein
MEKSIIIIHRCSAIATANITTTTTIPLLLLLLLLDHHHFIFCIMFFVYFLLIIITVYFCITVLFIFHYLPITGFWPLPSTLVNELKWMFLMHDFTGRQHEMRLWLDLFVKDLAYHNCWGFLLHRLQGLSNWFHQNGRYAFLLML